MNYQLDINPQIKEEELVKEQECELKKKEAAEEKAKAEEEAKKKKEEEEAKKQEDDKKSDKNGEKQKKDEKKQKKDEKKEKEKDCVKEKLPPKNKDAKDKDDVDKYDFLPFKDEEDFDRRVVRFMQMFSRRFDNQINILQFVQIYKGVFAFNTCAIEDDNGVIGAEWTCFKKDAKKIMVEDFNDEEIGQIESDLDYTIDVSRQFMNKNDFTFFIDHTNKYFVDGKCRFMGFMNTIKQFKDFRIFKPDNYKKTRIDYESQFYQFLKDNQLPNYKYLVEDEIGEEEGVPQQFTFDFLKYEADIDYKTYFILNSLHDNMRVYNDNVMEGLNTDQFLDFFKNKLLPKQILKIIHKLEIDLPLEKFFQSSQKKKLPNQIKKMQKELIQNLNDQLHHFLNLYQPLKDKDTFRLKQIVPKSSFRFKEGTSFKNKMKLKKFQFHKKFKSQKTLSKKLLVMAKYENYMRQNIDQKLLDMAKKINLDDPDQKLEDLESLVQFQILEDDKGEEEEEKDQSQDEEESEEKTDAEAEAQQLAEELANLVMIQERQYLYFFTIFDLNLDGLVNLEEMFIAYKRILFFGSFLEKNEYRVKIEKIIKEFKDPFDQDSYQKKIPIMLSKNDTILMQQNLYKLDPKLEIDLILFLDTFIYDKVFLNFAQLEADAPPTYDLTLKSIKDALQWLRIPLTPTDTLGFHTIDAISRNEINDPMSEEQDVIGVDGSDTIPQFNDKLYDYQKAWLQVTATYADVLKGMPKEKQETFDKFNNGDQKK